MQGIAATLLALALLAERSAGRSFPVRFIVLAILWRAEAVARAFVARTIEADWPCPDLPCLDEVLPMRSGAADAEILALRLRMLAALVGALSGVAGRSAGEEIGSHGAPRLPVLLVVRLPERRFRRPPGPHDTS